MIYTDNILKLDPKWQQTVKEICSRIDASGDRYLNTMTIFGSVARCEASPESDLDVYLEYGCGIMDDDYIIDNDITKATDIISMCTNGNNDIIFDSLADEFLMKQIGKDGIKVYDRDPVL
ncbi:MAG: hypothetical protein IJT87_11285 [Ruminiclostridium sp.]|nr:hypothetical protein [Ruminiclostridium sp.]